MAFAIFGKYAYSQDCFNENDSIVSSLACVDANATFDMNYQAAIINNPSQPKFVVFDGSLNHAIPSWYMMDKKGNFFNIHQYGFTVNDIHIIITYKILKIFELADVAIVINGKPFYHKISYIYKNNKIPNCYDIVATGGTNSNQLQFDLNFIGDSNLAGIQLGDLTIAKHSY
jgi:hypothetical protein